MGGAPEQVANISARPRRVKLRAAALALVLAAPAAAQDVPADLTHDAARAGLRRAAHRVGRSRPAREVQPRHDPAGRIAFARPDQYGDRFWLTDAEFAERLEAARRSDAAYSEESSRGTRGLEAWMQAEPFARRTSMLVSPADGKLPR
jgi:hypothetical protein